MKIKREGNRSPLFSLLQFPYYAVISAAVDDLEGVQQVVNDGQHLRRGLPCRGPEKFTVAILSQNLQAAVRRFRVSRDLRLRWGHSHQLVTAGVERGQECVASFGALLVLQLQDRPLYFLEIRRGRSSPPGGAPLRTAARGRPGNGCPIAVTAFSFWAA